MVAAAYELLSVDRNCDWLAELEQIVSRFDALPSAAQVAVRSVVESLLRGRRFPPRLDFLASASRLQRAAASSAGRAEK